MHQHQQKSNIFDSVNRRIILFITIQLPGFIPNVTNVNQVIWPCNMCKHMQNKISKTNNTNPKTCYKYEFSQNWSILYPLLDIVGSHLSLELYLHVRIGSKMSQNCYTHMRILRKYLSFFFFFSVITV